MSRNRPTVADLRAMKGKRQLTMLRVMTLDEAEAAERAGIDIVSIPPELLLDPQYRDAAPSLFSMPGENFFEIGTADDFVRWAFRMYKAGADAVYCSASYATVKRMADEAIPGHRPCRPDPVARAPGPAASRRSARPPKRAMQIFEAVKQLEAAGAFGAEIEVVPVEVAEAISQAHLAVHALDGRRHRLRRAVSLRRGRARPEPRPHAAPLQGLPQLRRRIRPAAGGARRRLLRIRRRCRTARPIRRKGTSCAWTRPS